MEIKIGNIYINKFNNKKRKVIKIKNHWIYCVSLNDSSFIYLIDNFDFEYQFKDFLPFKNFNTFKQSKRNKEIWKNNVINMRKDYLKDE